MKTDWTYHYPKYDGDKPLASHLSHPGLEIQYIMDPNWSWGEASRVGRNTTLSWLQGMVYRYRYDLPEVLIKQNKGMTFPKDGKERDRYPMLDGLLNYFPDALAGVALVSKVGSEKHNPGEPMRWAREKSTNHGDKIIRHLMDAEQIDPDTNLPEALNMAWRALAFAQIVMEKFKDKQGTKDIYEQMWCESPSAYKCDDLYDGMPDV